jgi:hypothetical protein
LSRRIHFLWFCKQHHLIDWIFLVDTAEDAFDTELLNYVMASYAIFLAAGHAIRSKSIRGDTISNYHTDFSL